MPTGETGRTLPCLPWPCLPLAVLYSPSRFCMVHCTNDPPPTVNGPHTTSFVWHFIHPIEHTYTSLQALASNGSNLDLLHRYYKKAMHDRPKCSHHPKRGGSHPRTGVIHSPWQVPHACAVFGQLSNEQSCYTASHHPPVHVPWQTHTWFTTNHCHPKGAWRASAPPSQPPPIVVVDTSIETTPCLPH